MGLSRKTICMHITLMCKLSSSFKFDTFFQIPCVQDTRVLSADSRAGIYFSFLTRPWSDGVLRLRSNFRFTAHKHILVLIFWPPAAGGHLQACVLLPFGPQLSSAFFVRVSRGSIACSANLNFPFCSLPGLLP